MSFPRRSPPECMPPPRCLRSSLPLVPRNIISAFVEHLLFSETKLKLTNLELVPLSSSRRVTCPTTAPSLFTERCSCCRGMVRGVVIHKTSRVRETESGRLRDETNMYRFVNTHQNNKQTQSVKTDTSGSICWNRARAKCFEEHISHCTRTINTECMQLTFASLEKSKNTSGSMSRVKKMPVRPQKSRSPDPKYAAGSTKTSAARKAIRKKTAPRMQTSEGQVIIHPRDLSKHGEEGKREGFGTKNGAGGSLGVGLSEVSKRRGAGGGGGR